MPNDIIKVDFGAIELQSASRAMAVQARLKDIRLTVEERFFEMCELLTEAHDNDYHAMYGYSRFGDWIEKGSGLDVSARTGFYYVNITKKAKALGLTRDALTKIGITKLKEVFSLDTASHADTIKALLEEAPGVTVDELKGKVAQVKTNNGQELSVYTAFKLEAPVKRMLDKAFILARLQYGNQVDEHGEVQEASHSKCIELLALAYLQDPTNYPEGVSEGDL